MVRRQVDAVRGETPSDGSDRIPQERVMEPDDPRMGPVHARNGAPLQSRSQSELVREGIPA